ncbi:hypothetical protein L1049_012842 [Liquidambar formosana]|uniref:Homeobox domain-containing protein n=1 Tax=Liquidambar formosana TaxID=63359 RepID=A0AAP0RK65_LIQFO
MSSSCLTLSLSPYKKLGAKMEGENAEVSTASGTHASSRWNPTKEQISMLESLYKQGIRTPSAEQIQQITSRLKAYGHIEGKNVFYWFQNHKARQRQKQKQESMAYINRYLHKAASPVFPPPPCPNVVCGPYYLPQSDIAFYPQYSKVLLPPTSGIKGRPRTEKVGKTKPCGVAGYEPTHPGHGTAMHMGDTDQETLALFPLHPTGILQGKKGNSSNALETAENSTTPSSSSEITGLEECSSDQPFFDFFSGRGSCESN